MTAPRDALIALEKKFWQAIVDEDTGAALALLTEPALMVTSHGATKFDHAGYRKMAEQGSIVVKSFELSDFEVVCPNDATAVLTYRVKQDLESRDGGETVTQEMNDTSTWVQMGGGWRCVMHTETPANSRGPQR